MSRPDKKGRAAAVICRIIGTLILVFVILTFLPVTVPRWMGYEVYGVVSGSMEPMIPVGSIVYVKPAEGEDISVGEVIAYSGGGAPIVHRVIENHPDEKELITKGDANDTKDLTPIPYQQVIGRVTKHFPVIGNLLMVWSGSLGKILLLCLAVSGALFNIIAGRLSR